MSTVMKALACLCVSAAVLQPMNAVASWLSKGSEQTATVVASEKVNINTADFKALKAVKHLGKVRAKAILDYRAEHGAFSSVSDIKKVPGIGKVVYEQVFPCLTT